ncbi:uncharacterized protein LOC115819259 [Chanos chanos]|uniref:Uncharacterized protein LOC115819259 n=1 Tax=Chanos chanos TaxID=29144 RepID=A0A6J2W374_CHACN|nr:uncharacterized protein LOC115819259 [Chanos chanos]
MMVQKLKHSYIPDPSKYFDELYSYHKGNFKSWLGPSTVIEVLTPSEAEDISQVKVQKLQNSSSVLLKVFVSGSQQPQDDSSPHSPKFSNSDHLLSQTSVSPCEELEPCSPVSPYRPVRIESDGNCEMADAGGNSIDRDDCDRLQVTSSSEEMDKLHRKTRSLDSGFAGGSEDQDSHEVSDLDDESLQSPSSPLETDNVPSNATVPCSSIWPPLLGLCGVPFRFPEFLGNLEGKPLEGVTSGMLDTSTDDYRPLKEVESTG